MDNNLFKIDRTALPLDTKGAIGNQKPENFALLFNRMGNFAEKEKLERDKPTSRAEGKALVEDLIGKEKGKEIKFHFFHKTRDSKIKQDYLLDLTMEWSLSNAQKEGYKKFHNEYAKAIQSLCPGIEPFSLKADWRIALGIGNASVYENGFTFHPTYGMPYLPGSSLKGMTRHWAVAKGKDKAEDYLKIFGNEQDGDKDFQQGRIIFFDALPTQLSQDMVQADIMNNHYPDYYEGNKFPADWLSPRPIFFLTMKGVAFQFHLGYIPRAGEEQDEQLLKTAKQLLGTAKQWLECALEEAGVGAKTAVGYGRISKPQPSPGDGTVRRNCAQSEALAKSSSQPQPSPDDEAQRSRQPQPQSKPKGRSRFSRRNDPRRNRK